jgi:hypothetical protein
MTEDPRDLKVENALLRGSQYLTARALKDYQEARHVKVDHNGGPMLQVTILESIRTKTIEVLAKAQPILRDEGHRRG